MNRRSFLGSAVLFPIIAKAMKDKERNYVTSSENSTDRMPVLFVGHGSPMNAISVNDFVQSWRSLGQSLPTIHDFGGFPKALFEVQYPAPGSVEFANETKAIISKTEVGLDQKWGLDHGAWSVIKNMYPLADIPVFEMSLDYYQSPGFHYQLAKELSPLREKGVLIMGSGNIVHNLSKVAWDKADEPEYGYDWAIEANDTFKKLIIANRHNELIHYSSLGKEVQLAVPTPEHYLPLLYALALKSENEKVTFFNDKPVMGSLSMTSLRIG